MSTDHRDARSHIYWLRSHRMCRVIAILTVLTFVVLTMVISQKPSWAFFAPVPNQTETGSVAGSGQVIWGESEQSGQDPVRDQEGKDQFLHNSVGLDADGEEVAHKGPFDAGQTPQPSMAAGVEQVNRPRPYFLPLARYVEQPTPTPTPENPTKLRVSPVSGTIGTRFIIEGSGFMPGERVWFWVVTPARDVVNDPNDHVANAKGNTRTTLRINGGYKGTYTVHGRGMSGLEAQATFALHIK